MAQTNYLLIRVMVMMAAVVVATLGMVLASGGPIAWAQTAPTNTIKVNTIEDETTPNDGKCSLREAIQNANDNAQTSPDCQAGSATGGDRIVFSLGDKATTIVVGSQLPDISDSSGLTIDGRKSKITISGDDSVRVFAVSAGAKLTLKNLSVAHGKAGPFGGGAYNDVNGTLIVDHSTFSNNSGANDGGGIYNATGATLEVTNSTFSDWT